MKRSLAILAGPDLAHLNAVVTVQQLIDLVAFLQPLYDLMPPENNHYRYIYL